MKVTKIQNYINTKSTGLVAAGTMGMTLYSGITKIHSIKKTHKIFSILTAITTLAHIGLIKYYHYRYRQKSD